MMVWVIHQSIRKEKVPERLVNSLPETLAKWSPETFLLILKMKKLI